MTRNVYFFIILFFILNVYDVEGEITIKSSTPPENASDIGVFIKYDEWGDYILNLPYEVGDDVEYIFDEDTPYAIDIIEIKADGEKLSFILDLSALPYARRYVNVKEIVEGKKKYFMTMYWFPEYIGEQALRWNDGLGLFFVEGTEAGYIAPWTNSYQISEGMKTLEITYRIMLPYPSLSIKNIRDKNYEDKIYTKEYTITVDISKLFPIIY